MPLNEDQMQQLTNGGDCPLHHHRGDTVPTNDTVQRLAGVENWRTAVTTQDLLREDDYVLADSTAGTITLTLPNARNGKKITITKIVAVNTVTVAATSGYNVLGAGSVNLTAAWSVLRLKLFDNTWINI